MKQKPEFCKNCPINHVTEGYVPLFVGGGRELWIGEAAGEEEAKSGKPFVGGAGAWLSSLCRAAKINRSSLNIINTIGCRPPENVYPTDPKWSNAVAFHFQKELAAKEKELQKVEKKYGVPSAKYQELYTVVRRLREELPNKKSTNVDGRDAVKYCHEHHLARHLHDGWSRIVTLGDQALRAATGRRGVTLWRGSPLPLSGGTTPKVIPTLHPAFLMRNAGLFSVAVNDIGKRPVVPREEYNLFPTLEDVEKFTSKRFSFDFEWDWNGKITLCGLSDRYNAALVVPWIEPFVRVLRRIFEDAEVLIGHNIIGADLKHFEDLRWNIKAKFLDTMLMQHLVQPDLRHGLAFVASVFSNKVFWKGTGEEQEDYDGGFMPTGPQWKTWSHPDALPRELGGYGGCRNDIEAYRLYNARDTDATLQCADPLLNQLKRYDLEDVYWNVSIPAGFICRELGAKGLKLDTSRVQVIRAELEKEIEEQQKKLPEGLAPYEVPVQRQVEAPPNTYKTVTRSCKGGKKYGGSHPAVVVDFDRPGSRSCTICSRDIPSGKMTLLKRVKVLDSKVIVPWNSTPQVLQYARSKGCKTVLNAKTGSETANKTARKVWGREHAEFALVDTLKKLGTQAQTFAKEALLTQERIYFNLLVHGTSEGRLSSSGQRKGIDPNIQNQPKTIRKIYVPDFADWCFVCADVVQGENMLTAWLAKDWERWERLHSPGFDEHSYMAARFFNKPYESVCKEGEFEYLRKPAKVINHGRNYGLGKVKTQQYLEEQGFFYSLGDIQEMLDIWRKENARTAAWQEETVALAMSQSFLRNPFGRTRWFQSRDYATKALAFLPASTLADMVLRMMIGFYPNRFAQEIANLNLQATGELPKDWSLRIQVHDELACQGPQETHLDAARVLRHVMTQPWPQLGGFKFDVEVVHSSSSWGETKRIEC